MGRLVSLVLAFTVVTLAASSAQAKRKSVMPYHRGYEVFDVGPLPESIASRSELAGARAGFRCKVWGILWTHFSMEGCEPVAHVGDQAMSSPEISNAVSEAYGSDEIQMSFWARHGRWFLIGGLILIIALALVGAVRGGPKSDGE